MKIFLEEVNNAVPVTIMKLVGDIDASCYKDVIEAGRKVFNSGIPNLLMDLGEVGFMSSSGLVALHSVALIMRGELTPDLEQGWSAMHTASDYVEESSSFERHFKLLNPTLRVKQILEKTGFDHTFEIFTSRQTAIASFS